MTPTLSSAVLIAAILVAQSRVPSESNPVDTPHLTITTSTSAASVAVGGRVSLIVEVVPKPKIHVYAPEQKAYLPVSLRLDRSPGITARSPVFPKGESFFFEPTSEMQIVYSQPFRIELPVTVGRERQAGPLALTGTLQYQACDDRVCYLPRKVPVTWNLNLQ